VLEQRQAGQTMQHLGQAGAHARALAAARITTSSEVRAANSWKDLTTGAGLPTGAAGKRAVTEA